MNYKISPHGMNYYNWVNIKSKEQLNMRYYDLHNIYAAMLVFASANYIIFKFLCIFIIYASSEQKIKSNRF